MSIGIARTGDTSLGSAGQSRLSQNPGPAATRAAWRR